MRPTAANSRVEDMPNEQGHAANFDDRWKTVVIDGERNLLELVRKANIDLPTFCYTPNSACMALAASLLQVKGAIQGACSTPPEPGMKVQTTTGDPGDSQDRGGVLLGKPRSSCPTCSRSANFPVCKVWPAAGREKGALQVCAPAVPLERVFPSLARRPNKSLRATACACALIFWASAR